MTPAQFRLRAQIAANARWSRRDARKHQADAARAAIYARLERQVDPGMVLPPEERAALVESAMHKMSAEMNAAKARKRAARRKAA
jgi:hypothetical protein